MQSFWQASAHQPFADNGHVSAIIVVNGQIRINFFNTLAKFPRKGLRTHGKHHPPVDRHIQGRSDVFELNPVRDPVDEQPAQQEVSLEFELTMQPCRFVQIGRLNMTGVQLDGLPNGHNMGTEVSLLLISDLAAQRFPEKPKIHPHCPEKGVQRDALSGPSAAQILG